MGPIKISVPPDKNDVSFLKVMIDVMERRRIPHFLPSFLAQEEEIDTLCSQKHPKSRGAPGSPARPLFPPKIIYLPPMTYISYNDFISANYLATHFLRCRCSERLSLSLSLSLPWKTSRRETIDLASPNFLRNPVMIQFVSDVQLIFFFTFQHFPVPTS
jgi:hypothetical protein